jgi:hypothetical protein
MPGRREQRTERPRNGHRVPPVLQPGQAATEMLVTMLGPMRWLSAQQAADLSEAWGGKPGDAGWLLEFPGEHPSRIVITVSRPLGAAQGHARVVLFQELRGYAGLTWYFPATTPEHLERIAAEVRALLADGARVVRLSVP